MHSIHLNSRHFGVNNRRCATQQSTEWLGYISARSCGLVLSVRGCTLNAGHKANARGCGQVDVEIMEGQVDVVNRHCSRSFKRKLRQNVLDSNVKKYPCLGELIPERKFQLFKRGCILVVDQAIRNSLTCSRSGNL